MDKFILTQSHHRTQNMSIKLAVQTLFFLTSLCIPMTSGLMTPGMIRRMATAGRPPLRPQVQGEVSSKCEADLAELIATETGQLISVLDAIGKPQPGLMHGNLAWLGHFDECKSVTGFNYCLTYLQLQLPANSSNAPNVFGAASATLIWGLCVPESCSDSDILFSLQDLLELVEAPFNLSVVNASSVVCAQDPAVPYNSTGFIVTLFFLGLIACLMLLGAFLDKTLRSINYKPPATAPTPGVPINGPIRVVDAYPYQRVRDTGREGQVESEHQGEEQELEEEVPTACTKFWHQFVLSFAVNRNLAKLLGAKTAEGSISCLNGIRVISMTWVILGHVSSFVMGTGIVGNPLHSYGFITHFGFQAVANAFFSVDSFFFLSGLLVAYMALGRMVKTDGKLPWLWFYFHRYWRLTPALGMTMLISLYLKPYLGIGPLWQTQASDPYCEKYWWTNLLYVNNFVGEGCIGWVWYLANDMQFFVISPPLLIMLYRVPIVGLVTLGVMCLASFITTGVLMAKYNFYAAMVDATNPHQDPNHSFNEEIYVKPYCRIAPYLVGMAMGYFFHLYKNKAFKLHPIVAMIGWVFATAVGMSLVYGLYPYYHGHILSTAENASYMALCRFAWAVCLSWVVFACHYGYGGWINDFLSWELWIPMSRLTYSAYLLHPLIITIYDFNYGNNYFYSIYMLAFEVAAIVTLAYVAAILMAVAIEFPLGNLEKLFMPLADKKTK